MKYYLSVIVILIITFLISPISQLTKEDYGYLSYEESVEAAATTIDETRERWKDIMKQEGEDALREYLESSFGDLDFLVDITIKDIKEEIQKEDNSDSPNLSNVPQKLEFQTFTNEKIGVTLQYPKDWSEANDGMEVFKGSKEFEISLFNTVGLSLLDSKEFTKMLREIYSEDSEKEVLKSTKTDEYEIDGIKTSSFQYLDSNRKIQAVGIIHNDQGYVFKYKTLKDDFDDDKGIMTQIFNSIRLLD